MTYLSYLRTVDLKQRAAAKAMTCVVNLSRAKMASLLSLEDSSYVSRLMKERLTAAGLWQSEQTGYTLAQASLVLST